MAQCHAEGKKHLAGAIELYVGVFNTESYNSRGGNGNVDHYQSWAGYSAFNYNASTNTASYRKDVSSDRMALYCGSFHDDKIKNGVFTKTDARYVGIDGTTFKNGIYSNISSDHSSLKGAIDKNGLSKRAGKVGGVSPGVEMRNGASAGLAVGSSPICNGASHKREKSDLGFRGGSNLSGELSMSGTKPSEASLKVGPGNIAGSGNLKLTDSNAVGSDNDATGLKGISKGTVPSFGSLQVGGLVQGEAASNGGSPNSGSPNGASPNSGSPNGGSPTAARAARGERPSTEGGIIGNGASPTMGTVRGIGNIIIAGGSRPSGSTKGNLGNCKPASFKAVPNDIQPSIPPTPRGTTPKNSGELNSNCSGILTGASTTRNSGELNANGNGSLKGASTLRLSSEGNLNGGIITNSSPGGTEAKGTKSTAVSPPSANTGRPGIPNVGNICRGSVLTGGNLSNGATGKGSGKADVVNGIFLNPGNHNNGFVGASGNIWGIGNLGNGSVSKGTVKGDAQKCGAEAFGTANFHPEGSSIKRALTSTDAEEVKNAGNDQYKKGNFSEALVLYDRAITLSPGHAPYRSNKAAALTGLDRLAEAVQECEEANKLDPLFARAHQRAASLYLRIGLVESAKRHFQAAGQQADWGDLQRLQNVEKIISKCIELRKNGDWKAVIKESDAAIVAGTDSAPQIFGYKAEALLKLHRPEEADAVLAAAQRVESSLRKSGVTQADSFLLVLRAHIDLALGRNDGAMSAAESAARIDPRNTEVSALVRKARAVGHARTAGNELFKAGKFFEACASYGEGLESDPMNAVLLCNRAACRSKLGQWEKAVEDCSAALNAQPNYTKALMRRADCNAKLERWEDAQRDYEVLQREVPGDMEVARGLFDVHIAIKKSRGEEIYKMKFGGGVEEVSSNDHFREAVASPGLAVVQFNNRWSNVCRQISPFIDQLCKRYPSVNFVKVDVEDNPYLAKTESVSFVPTFKIYKNGQKVKEILGPSQQALEYAVKHFSL